MLATALTLSAVEDARRHSIAGLFWLGVATIMNSHTYPKDEPFSQRLVKPESPKDEELPEEICLRMRALNMLSSVWSWRISKRDIHAGERRRSVGPSSLSRFE